MHYVFTTLFLDLIPVILLEIHSHVLISCRLTTLTVHHSLSFSISGLKLTCLTNLSHHCLLLALRTASMN